MSRTIKASDVTPGMMIRWEADDSVIQTYAEAVKRVERGARMEITTRTGVFWYIRSDIPVTVLSEPLPEEPTTFGARVMAGGLMFVRGIHHERPWMVSLDGELYDWNDLCKLGSVAVIEAEPYWEIPTDVDSDSEVPKRIEEWDTWEDVPEGVAVTSPNLFCHYRKNQGIMIECSDPEKDPDWTKASVRTMPREYGPWTRATEEPTPEVPKRIEGWPEDDAALRAYGWMDRLGSVWRYKHTGATTGWICPGMSPQNQPWGSPFTRVTDA